MKKFIVLSTISLFVFALIATLTLNLAQVRGQTSDPGGSGGGVSLSGGCKPTAAAPTYSEAVANYLSCLLDGSLRIYNQYLGWGEDPNNDLVMTSGGKVRTFTLMTGVTTSTTSATQIVHSGGKTPKASLTGTGALTGTVTFYGDMENTTTNGEPICSLILDVTTKSTKSCNQFVKDWPYYHAVTSNIGGTSATVVAQIDVGAVGVRTDQWTSSGVKTSDALIKTGYGEVQCLIFSSNDGTPVSGTFSLLDSTSAGAGTALLPKQFWSTSAFVSYQLCPFTSFTTGLFFDFTTTSDVEVTASYR